VNLAFKMREAKTNTLYFFMLPSKICSLLRHRTFYSLYKWPSFPLLIFQHFKFCYWEYVLYEAIPWPNSTTVELSNSSILNRCKQSVPTWRLLFRTSLYIVTITVSVILQQFGSLITLIGYSCVENIDLYFFLFGPLGFPFSVVWWQKYQPFR
jgi:hypothetical protein